MSFRIWVAVAALAACGTAGAATFPAVISRDSAVEVENLSRLSVGLDYQGISRDVTVDGFKAEDPFEARAAGGCIAVDVTPWFSPFVTLGASSAHNEDTDEYGDYKFKWSVGMSFNLWQYEVLKPSWMGGRLYIKSVAEYSSYQSENVYRDGDTMDWSDISVVLPVCFEMFEELSPIVDKSLRTSLCLYVGPAFSKLDGTYERSGQEEDFESDGEFGVVAGVDIFVAENVAIGGQVMAVGGTSYSGSIRYHF